MPLALPYCMYKTKATHPLSYKIVQPSVILALLIFTAIMFRFFYLKTENKENQQKIITDANSADNKATPSFPNRTTYPSQVLNLTNWKITIPTITTGDAIEIKQPQLATYNLDPWFVAMSEVNAVRFRAAVNGTTTSGSDYPRSELREMTDSGTQNASWSSTDGTHTMYLDETITAVPKVKQDVVAGQIHDDKNDIIVIRLNYPILHIRVAKTNVYTLDPNYTFGKRFTVKFVVGNDSTKVYYNNSIDPVYTLNEKYSKAYFKAGVYTQSNCSREGSSLCDASNYGEVIVYKVVVTH